MNFFAKIFGHVKKKQYFCTRFRRKAPLTPLNRVPKNMIWVPESGAPKSSTRGLGRVGSQKALQEVLGKRKNGGGLNADTRSLPQARSDDAQWCNGSTTDSGSVCLGSSPG